MITLILWKLSDFPKPWSQWQAKLKSQDHAIFRGTLLNTDGLCLVGKAFGERGKKMDETECRWGKGRKLPSSITCSPWLMSWATISICWHDFYANIPSLSPPCPINSAVKFMMYANFWCCVTFFLSWWGEEVSEEGWRVPSEWSPLTKGMHRDSLGSTGSRESHDSGVRPWE